jgi:pyruvate dehydrogenase E2 component (dihydrolipoamide acetyltransferase)
VPLNKIRQITAEHMVRSLETSAHVYVSTEVDFEAVERVRRAHKDTFRAEEGVALTYLPFVARALVDALEEFPHVNASMGDDHTLVVHGSVNLGVAVDLDHEGLIVPVIHQAEGPSPASPRTRRRRPRPSSQRPEGAHRRRHHRGHRHHHQRRLHRDAFLLPIINQPQVMVLSTDGVKRRPVVVSHADGAESIAIHSVGNLTLGWDHRAFDGAYAAQFLARVRDILETRDWESEL